MQEKQKQIINESYILFCSERAELIDFVLKYADDEIQTETDWYNLAVLSTDQLKENIQHIIEYYKTELNEIITFKK
jgi:hypothetical protein|tara:strand:- start:243 stop:470 length:228 start_codon:yes stop_codon:yes gene_type:complete